MTEEQLTNNIIKSYDKANSNKIYVEGLLGNNIDVNVNESNSVYIWDCNNIVVKLVGKCNHVFIYNSSNVVVRVEDCISGLTCINSFNCKILFIAIPEYNIEVSNSDGINIRSSFFNTNIVHKSVEMNVIKSINCRVLEYYNVNDGMLSKWHCNYFNF